MYLFNTPEMRQRYAYLLNGYYNMESSVRNTFNNITYYLPSWSYKKIENENIKIEEEMIDMSAGKETDEYIIYPEDDFDNSNSNQIEDIIENIEENYSLLQSISLATSMYFKKAKTDEELAEFGFYPLSKNMFFAQQPWNMLVASPRMVRFDILEELITKWNISNLELDIVSSKYNSTNYVIYQKFVTNLKKKIENVNHNNAYLSNFDKETFQQYQLAEQSEHTQYWRQYVDTIFITILDEPSFEINRLEISKLAKKNHYLIILKESFEKIPDFVEYILLPPNQMKKLSKIVGHQYPNLNESNMYMVICHPHFQEIVNQMNFIRL